jgi:hypothetical protein
VPKRIPSIRLMNLSKGLAFAAEPGYPQAGITARHASARIIRELHRFRTRLGQGVRDAVTIVEIARGAT